MQVDVTTEIDIDRPRAEVDAFVADPDNATTWYRNIKSVRWETPKPVRVGRGRDQSPAGQRCAARGQLRRVPLRDRLALPAPLADAGAAASTLVSGRVG